LCNYRAAHEPQKIITGIPGLQKAEGKGVGKEGKGKASKDAQRKRHLVWEPVCIEHSYVINYHKETCQYFFHIMFSSN